VRTTLNLDQDVYDLAHEHARRQKISIGEAVSALVRQGLRAQSRAPLVGATRSRFALLPARDEVITSDHVRTLMEQEGI
jgi:hypothetical protein